MMLVNGWWVIVGMVAAGGMGYCWAGRNWRRRMERRQTEAQTDIAKARARCKAWEEFAGCAAPLIPVLVEQLQSVSAQTEAAALELGARFRDISQRAKEQAREADSLFGGSGGAQQKDGITVETILGETDRTLSKFVQDVVKTSQVATNVVTVMEEVATNTKAIAGILAEVEFLADQTRLLALNAAIEAARAGEHGRGFAVVAEEVTKLANRSGQAATNIRKLVGAVNDSAGRAMKELETLASVDMSDTLKAKDRLGGMTHAMLQTNAALQSSVKQATGRAEALVADIAQIVMSMQFQDITRQRIEHVMDPLRAMRECMTALVAGENLMGSSRSLEAIRNLEKSYTIETERAVMRTVNGNGRAVAGTGGQPANGTRVPQEQPALTAVGGDDSVTLF